MIVRWKRDIRNLSCDVSACDDTMALTGGPGGPTNPGSPFWPCEPWQETRHHWKTSILINNEKKNNCSVTDWKQQKSDSHTIPWSLSGLQHPVRNMKRRWEMTTVTLLVRRSVGERTYRETRRTRRTQRTRRTTSTLKAEDESSLKMNLRHFTDV